MINGRSRCSHCISWLLLPQRENNHRVPINLKLAPTGNVPKREKAMLKNPLLALWKKNDVFRHT